MTDAGITTTALYVTTLAAINGALVEVSLGPLDGVVPGWVGRAPVLEVDVSLGLMTLVLVGTAINVVVGLGTTWDHARAGGATSYAGAFLGGQLFLYSPAVGSAVILASVGIAVLTAARAGSPRASMGRR
jgi:hypothetical protein